MKLHVLDPEVDTTDSLHYEAIHRMAFAVRPLQGILVDGCEHGGEIVLAPNDNGVELDLIRWIVQPNGEKDIWIKTMALDRIQWAALKAAFIVSAPKIERFFA